VRVMQLLLWPTTQSPDYGPSALPDGISGSLAAAATVLTILLLLLWSSRLAFRSDRRDARPFAAVVWCLIAYLPASNLLAATGAIIAERTLYMASVGVAMLLAWSLERALALAAARHDSPTPARSLIARPIPALVAGGLIAICARGYVRTRDYARVWHDRHSLFSQMVQADSLDYRGYQLLAIEAKDERRYDESARLYARAYALRPFDQTLLLDYGGYLLETGRRRYALAMGERLLRYPDAWTDPAAVTLLLNATAQVWGVDSVLVAARRLDARAPSARAALFTGLAYDAKGDSASAQAAYRVGLQRAPSDSALNAHLAARAR
jgi:tetratricopeptide (TPR) repeat protein